MFAPTARTRSTHRSDDNRPKLSLSSAFRVVAQPSSSSSASTWLPYQRVGNTSIRSPTALRPARHGSFAQSSPKCCGLSLSTVALMLLAFLLPFAVTLAWNAIRSSAVPSSQPTSSSSPVDATASAASLTTQQQSQQPLLPDQQQPQVESQQQQQQVSEPQGTSVAVVAAGAGGNAGLPATLPAGMEGGDSGTSPAWRPKDSQDPGYLYGWTASSLAYRMGWAPAMALTTPVDGGALRLGGKLRREGVVTVAASGHTLAVLASGELVSWGRDWDLKKRPAGLLGRGQAGGGSVAFWRPGRVEGLEGEGQVVAVATGKFHSVAIVESGKVFTWGLNNRGQLGRHIDRKEDGFRPGVVGGALAGKRALAVVSGPYFTIVITEEGRLYTWGANCLAGEVPWSREDDSSFDPQPGDSDEVVQQRRAAEDMAAVVRVVPAGQMGAEQVMEVDAGSDHWVAVTGALKAYVCSTGFSPQGIRINSEEQRPWLGVHHAVPLSEPALVDTPAGMEVQFVAAAHHTTFLIASDHKAYSFGEPSPLLGRSWQEPTPPNKPSAVGQGVGLAGAPLVEGPVTQVAAGERFAVAHLESGKLFSWGDNRYGQLGRPAGVEDPSPSEVQGLEGLKVLLLVAGSQQGLALCHHEQGQEDVVALQEKDDTPLLAIPVDKMSLVDPDALGNRRR